MLFLWLACVDSKSTEFSSDSDALMSGFGDVEDTGYLDGDLDEDLIEDLVNPFPVDDSYEYGLTNTSFVLEEVLEYGALEDACELYSQFPNDEDLQLRCGKAMFFYEGFGGLGIPQPLLDFVSTKFPDELGPAFSEYGMIPDPYSEEGRPIGYGVGSPMGSVETLAYSCASCHFGQLPDGRYSVGMSNNQYATGKQFLSLMLLPQSVMPGFDDSEHDPDALAIIEPLREKLRSSPLLFAQMGWNLLPLLWESDMSAASITRDVEEAYASWKTGTMDVFIPPLPIDDEIHIVSKIPTIWSIPNQTEQHEFEMESAMLSWSGGSPSLDHFVNGFLALGDSESWTIEDVEPLLAYLETLKAPSTLDYIDEMYVDKGQGLFNAECLSCHQGYQGSSIELYSFEEIGTDDQMKYILDADLDGVPVFGVEATPTHQIKAPRLTGVWAKERLLHNGSVNSLEELFCMNGPRNDNRPIFGNVGHTYGCDWSENEKIHIIEFLQSI